MPLSPKRGPVPVPESPRLKARDVPPELRKPKKKNKVVDSMQTSMIVDIEGTELTKLCKEERRARKAAKKQLVDIDVEAEISESLSKEEKRARKAAKKQSEDTIAEAEISESLSKEERRARKAAKKQLVETVVEAEVSESLSKEERMARKAAKKQSSESEDTTAEAEISESLSKEERRARKAAKKQLVDTVVEAEVSEILSKEERMARKAAKKQSVDTVGVEISESLSKEERMARKATKKQKEAVETVDDTHEELSSAKKSKRKREEEQEAQKRLKGEAGCAIPVVPVLGAKEYRSKHEITVNFEAEGDCPAPFENFEAVAPEIGQALTKALRAQGYAAPTPIQAQAWPVALEGKDMIAVAKTGSGKTCAFLLPALKGIQERGPAGPPKKISYYQSEPTCPSVLVVAPTRELCQQIAVEAAKFAPAVRSRVVAIYGGVGKAEQLRDLRKGADIIIATPGRLIDFCNGAPGREDLGPSVDLKNVKYLVLDEADRMLDMGFEPDIQKIASRCPNSKNRQTLFFTATWPKAVKAAAASLTGSDTVQLRIGQNGGSDKLMANKDVKQIVMVMRRDEKLAALKKILKEQLAAGETAFVFGSTKMICDKLEEQLGGSNNYSSELGVWCRAIHSGKEQWDRDEALARFRSLTAGTGSEKGVLIATDVAARGLDIPGVALVVIYDFGSGPRGNANNAVESYVHKIGRTGRAGKTGRAFTLFTSEDHGAYKLCELLRGANQEVPRELDELAWHNPKQSGFSKGKGQGKGGGKGGGKSFSKGKGKGKSGGKAGKGGKSFSKGGRW